jgi:hypothetical protein
VDFPGEASLEDLNLTDPRRVDFISTLIETSDYGNISHALEQKDFTFNTDRATVSYVKISINITGTVRVYQGTVMSMWSTNTGSNGTRAFIAAAMIGGKTLCVGAVTNLLPPNQIPGVDPYIIVNAMPYLYISLYWWVWSPVAAIHTWYYWWYDSHNHPNWYWGVYWWWRTDVDHYWIVPGRGVWLPWWWWFWHWLYWKHWYWWSTYFPY